ncbi:MAG: hypothetical protein GY694_06020 [Gammaproteobacteria bacterium]|nr:hypothetical protein [Gammaproteobacteria bacterium]
MINSLKAIVLGVTTIFILGLVNQLVLIMAAVAYNALIKMYPLLAPWSQVFTYVLAGIGVFIVMALGGLVTAKNAAEQAYIKAIIAAIIGSSISLYLSLQEEIFTPIAFLFLLYAVSSSVIGCWIWQKYQNKQTP